MQPSHPVSYNCSCPCPSGPGRSLHQQLLLDLGDHASPCGSPPPCPHHWKESPSTHTHYREYPALRTTHEAARLPGLTVSIHASLPAVDVGHLMPSQHPNSFLVLKHFPLGKDLASHHGSQMENYSFLLPRAARV